MHELHVVDALDLARAFVAAEYTVAVDDATLPLSVGRCAPALEAAWPSASYAFITAWNPASSPSPEAVNRQADRRLCTRLDEAGVARRPASAQDTAGRWLECGWLLADADVGFVDLLGREFGQAGVLAWSRGEPVRLRMLVPRRGHAEGLACVDWVE